MENIWRDMSRLFSKRAWYNRIICQQLGYGINYYL